MKNNILKTILIDGYILFQKIYMLLIHKFVGVDNNKVVFISFNGKTYSDNPKAISEALHKIDDTINITWLFVDPESRKQYVPDYVRMVKIGKYQGLKELATAKVWVDNFCKPKGTFKGKDQYYVQTWHGDRGFKKVLHDSSFVSYKYSLLESEKCDLMVSASDFCDNVYRSAFKYDGEILKVGSPRNDALVNNDMKTYYNVRENLGIDPKTKLLLYAPTLRRASTSNGKLQDAGEIDLEPAMKILEEKTGDKWICMVRSHVSVIGLSGIPDTGQFLDVSKYEDMADLLQATDLLITDYSSSGGDLILLNRPVILFQNDRQEYVEYDRTFYFELDDCPYYMVQNQNEFEEVLSDIWNRDIDKNCSDILKFYNTIETGKSSEEIAKRISKKCR